MVPLHPDLLRRSGLFADLLEEGFGASSVRALVVDDLGDQPRFRVLCQDRASVHIEGELQTLWRRRALRSRGNRDLGAIVRRLRLGDVVESGRGVGPSTQAMAA